MTVRKILRIGDSRLRQKSEPVNEFATPELDELVRDMLDTMMAADGAGLAAIQIGVPKRVMIFGFESNPRYPDVGPIPFTVLVNPDLEILDAEMDGGWEGCLSVPDMRGFVQRHGRIRYHGFDQQGVEITREVDGFHARVFQHEFDHLEGILYPDLIDDPLKFGFWEELEASGLM
jgi:peptide deformylase